MPITVTGNFDGGSVAVEAIEEGGRVKLTYRADPGGVFKGWMSCRLSGVRGQRLEIVLTNAGACSYPEGFYTLQMVGSYDRQTWFRLPTQYDGTVQTIDVLPARDTLYLANTPPYGYERHLDFIAQAHDDPAVSHDILGHSIENRPIDRVRVGDGPAQVWIVARQHPCEPMANWFVEGLVERLLDRADAVSTSLRDHACFNIVPMINPDGAANGYMRTNAAGRDLNREWAAPSSDRSPEVVAVLAGMHASGVSVLLDIHGDEVANHTYAYGLHNPPDGNPTGPAALSRFIAALEGATPDFRAADADEIGLPDVPDMSMCTQHVVWTFGCLGATIEMPFNDTARRHPVTGWGIARSRAFGAATLQALHQVRSDWL